VNSHPRASFIPSNLTHSAIYLPSPETNNPPETSDAYSRVFNSNTKWRGSMAERDPALFERLSKGQSPQILWIGCADSRCPETTILGLNPGDVFVHRNIANILIPTDLNSLSVIQYAVQYLEVKHIVVCGHTSCGGIAAALDNKKLGLIDMWLMPLRQLRRENLKLLESMDEKAKGLKLVELNVRSGIDTLMDNPVVLDAVTERGLKVHGLIYDVGTGELNELDINETEEKINSRTTAFKTA
jgi:carbonic anhydrase